MITEIDDDRILERLARSLKLEDDRRFRQTAPRSSKSRPRPSPVFEDWGYGDSPSAKAHKNGSSGPWARMLTPQYLQILDIARFTDRAFEEVSYCASVLGLEGISKLTNTAPHRRWSEVADAALLYGREPILDNLADITHIKDEYGQHFFTAARAVVHLGKANTEIALTRPELRIYSLDTVVSVLHVTQIPANSESAVGVVGHVARLFRRYGHDVESVADAYRTLGFLGASLACIESKEFGVPLDTVIRSLIDEYGLAADGLAVNGEDLVRRMNNTMTDSSGELLPMSGPVRPRSNVSPTDAQRYDLLTGNSARRGFDEMRGDVVDYGMQQRAERPVHGVLAWR